MEAKPPEVQSTAREREYRELRARFFSGTPRTGSLSKCRSSASCVASCSARGRARQGSCSRGFASTEGDTRAAAELVTRAKLGGPDDFVTITEAAGPHALGRAGARARVSRRDHG